MHHCFNEVSSLSKIEKEEIVEAKVEEKEEVSLEQIDKKIDDLMLICYLLNKNIRNDIAYIANCYQYDIKFYDICFI